MKKMKLLLVFAGVLLLHRSAGAQDTNWVKNNTWYFDNFVKDILPWSLFKETFIGVAPTPSGDFDILFYESIYKKQLASSGHCYGMNVMAMLMKKNGGHLGFCHPPYMYSGTIFKNSAPEGSPSNDTVGPADPILKRAIQLVHGNQINHGFLLYLLDVIAMNKNRNGAYACDQVDYYLAGDDQPVISVTKSFSPADGGHVIIPYKTKDMGGGKKRIYVYDPNRTFYKPGPGGHGYYAADSNYIEVNTATKSWSFVMVGSLGTWSGDPGSGGNCLVIPLSVAGKRDRLPQSLLAEGAYAIATIFIFGDVKVEQFSDAEGRRYFRNNGEELETDESLRLNYLMPYMPLGRSDQKAPSAPAVYFFRGTRPVDITYRASGDYRIGMIWQGHYYEITGKGIGERDYFTIKDKQLPGKGKRGF